MQDTVQTILVIEDEDGVRNLLRTLLRLADYEVLSCQGGEEALDLMEARGGAIRLLITDVNLGTGMDGFETAQALRSGMPSLKVLYMSGEEDANRRADRAGDGDRFLAKPFTPRSFTDAVRAMLLPVSANAVS
jgi:DNA-binding response OmpR family regulator